MRFSIYIIAGLLWSFFKWYQFVQTRVKAWKIHAKGMEESKATFIPKVAEHVGKLSGWILIWPLSVVSFCLGDLWDKLVMWFESTYDKITQSQFK